MKHEQLHEILIKKPEDYAPYGEYDRDANWHPDCSSGCRFFIPLKGKLGYDWGVCANSESHRCGLLTFEHQGCPKFVPGDI